MKLMDAFLDEAGFHSQKEVWLAIRADGDSVSNTAISVGAPFGDGTHENPFAVNTPESFSYIMREKVLENTLVHLGPGLFHTRGMGGNAYEMDGFKLWQPKSGQKIIGSGVFATTLRFTFDAPSVPIKPIRSDPAIAPGPRLYMINDGSTYLPKFEISDLTIDCNLQNAPFDEDRITTAGVYDASSGNPIVLKAKVLAGGTTVETEGSTPFFDIKMIDKAIIFDEVPGPNGALIAVGSTIKTLVGTLINGKASRVTIEPEMTPMTAFYRFGVTGMRTSLTGLALCGENIRVRRVRIINFGVRTYGGYDGKAEWVYTEGLNNSGVGMQLTAEGFPLRIEGRNGHFKPQQSAESPSFNSWFEDCIIEQPHPSPAREVTLVVGSGAATGTFPPARKSSCDRFVFYQYGVGSQHHCHDAFSASM